MRTIAFLLALTFLALTLLDCGPPNTCTGQCLAPPGNAGGFHRTVLLWSGPVGTTPLECPQATPTASPGLLDTPPTAVVCNPPCVCTATAGGCTLSGTITAQTADCFNTTAPLIPFNPPPMWDGSCTAATPVAEATSVTVSGPALIPQAGCLPAGSKATTIEGGTTAAVLCLGPDRLPSGFCANGDVCSYPQAPGFSVCILGDLGLDLTCPLSWPNKHSFFGDDAECNCSCNDSVGESCSTTVTIYSDTACSTPLGLAGVTTDQPACMQFSPSTVGSKSATKPVYHPGTCGPIVVNSIGATLCCLP